MAIARSCAAWRSASNRAAWARRSASTARVASSNSMREKLFPSTSSKSAYRARPLPQGGSIGGSVKSMPRFDHSSNTARTSFGQKTEPGVLANPLRLRRSFRWNEERHTGQTSACCSGKPTSRAWSDNDPAARARNLDVHNCLETELVNKKLPASLLIANPDGCEI